MRFTNDALQEMSRTELRALAGEYGINKNLKSAAIIKLLLEGQELESVPQPGSLSNGIADPKEPEPLESGQPSTPPPPIVTTAASTTPPHSPPRGPRNRSLAPSPQIQNGLVYPVLNEENLQSRDGTFNAPRKEKSVRSLTSNYTFGTPESSVIANRIDGSDPLAPPHLLQNTIAIMDAIDRQDEELKKQVAGLRETAAGLRKQVVDLRAAVRSQKGRRERVQAYVLYWQNIQPGCSFEDMWCGRMRVNKRTMKEVSDDEGEGEDEVVGVVEEEAGQRARECSSSPKETETRPSRRPRNNQPLKDSLKRAREEEDIEKEPAEDVGRYQPSRFRFRLPGHPTGTDAGGTLQAPLDSESSRNSADIKGKRKMSGERPGDRERKGEDLAQSPPVPQVVRRLSTLTEEEVECIYGNLLDYPLTPPESQDSRVATDDNRRSGVEAAKAVSSNEPVQDGRRKTRGMKLDSGTERL